MPKTKDKPLSLPSISNILRRTTIQTAQMKSTSSNILPLVTTRVTEVALGTRHVTTNTVSYPVTTPLNYKFPNKKYSYCTKLID